MQPSEGQSSLSRQDKQTVIGRALLLAAGLTLFNACATSFDMTGERILLPGPEWGVVIGSVLVQPEEGAAVRDSYEFEIVQIQPGDPDGTRAYAPVYHLTVKSGEERAFVSRLHPGHYLIRSFHKTSVAGLGGDLDLIFSAEPGEVRYVGRVHVQVPRRLSRGKDYRFSIDNVRAETLTEIARQYPELAHAAVDGPMQARVRPVPSQE